MAVTGEKSKLCASVKIFCYVYGDKKLFRNINTHYLVSEKSCCTRAYSIKIRPTLSRKLRKHDPLEMWWILIKLHFVSFQTKVVLVVL
jgi:hypothetical protein